MNKQAEFEAIINNIINNKNYQELKNENHHGINRYEHSMRVAYRTYKISKKMKLDYKSATRAALLHDFFKDAEVKKYQVAAKYCKHPSCALINAKRFYTINQVEEDAIKNHMFPLTFKLPATKEGIVLSLVDKGVACYEYSRFKLANKISVILLLIINIVLRNNN